MIFRPFYCDDMGCAAYVLGCGTLGLRSRDEVAPLISVPGEGDGIRWR